MKEAQDTGVRVRCVRQADLSRLVEIHLAAFADHRSARLGPRYVRAVHEWFFAHPGAVNLVAEEEGRVEGFVEGVPDGYGRPMTAALRYVAVGALLSRPWLLFDAAILHTQRRRVRSLFGTADRDVLPPVRPRARPFVLTSIAVAPEAQGRGIAGVLMDAFEQRVREKGHACMRLSVYTDNTRAQRAYQKAGWVKYEVNDPFGTYYWKPLEMSETRT